MVGLAGFGAPGPGGVVELSVTGAVFGAAPHGPPVVPHAVAAVAVLPAPGVSGFGVPVVRGVALVLAAGWAGLGGPLFCGAVLALDADGAGFGAGVGAAELPPLDPLEGELEDAAGFGAGELPELEPLSEDDFAAAGFGAGEEPPEGAPAILATVRTTTVEDANPGVIAEEGVLA